VVVNPTPEKGQFSSLQRGISALFRDDNNHFKAAFILPIDVPCPPFEIWKKLVFAFETNERYYQAYLPLLQGKGGHPPLLSYSYLRSLNAVGPEQRLDIQLQHLPDDQIFRIEMNSSGEEMIEMNLNTPKEWQKFSTRDF
jgi:CTP:molybdopterin cytidylyltransferase MocA